jgi:hypothetical protein
MAKYLLSVHYVEGEPDLDDEATQQMFKDVGEVNREMESAGVYVFAHGLEEPHHATVVREVDGQIITTDGPFPEAKEHLGGFWVLDVADLDEALSWARQATVACRKPVEVRPFHPDEA